MLFPLRPLFVIFPNKKAIHAKYVNDLKNILCPISITEDRNDLSVVGNTINVHVS